jgi:hypothetical protein
MVLTPPHHKRGNNCYVVFKRNVLHQPGNRVVHKIHIYLEYHSVCPLVGIGTPHPLTDCAPPLNQGGGGGGTHSDDWRKSLALCLLCGVGVRGGTASFRPPPPLSAAGFWTDIKTA